MQSKDSLMQHLIMNLVLVQHVSSCKAINVTNHQLFDAINSNIQNKNVLNVAEATAVSNIPSKVSRKMFFPIWER